MPVEKIKFIFQGITGLLQLALDEFARRVMAQKALEPGAPVEIDDGDSRSGPEIFPQICKISDTVVEVVVGVAGKY